MSETRRTLTIIGILFGLIVWTGAAGGWDDKGCSLGQGYAFAVIHGGWPDQHEGCKEKHGSVYYTDDYGTW